MSFVQSAVSEELLNCRILVVDDNAFNRTVIGAMLEDYGYRNIVFAVNGFEALDSIAAEVPDIVMLDIMMPGMDGFEVCRRVRTQYRSEELPILVQTALSSMDDRNRAFEAGTTDLVSKPLERQELLARVRIHLENRLLIQRHRQYRERVQGELAIARSMYDQLSPSPMQLDWLHRMTQVKVRAHLRLSSDLGGTVWGAFPLEGDRKFAVFLLDVSGRGVSAALNAFRLHTLIQEMRSVAALPSALLTALNARAAALLEPGVTARLLCGVVDPDADTFQYASADAVAPRLMSPDASEPLSGEAGGPPIGDAADTVYRSATLRFRHGDIVMLDSRRMAIVEDEAEPAADPVVRAGLSAVGDAGSGTAFAWLRSGIDAMDASEFADDLAIIWLDRNGDDSDVDDPDEAAEG